ncbi:MAG: RBBP9/YdeN family alpha/beta hydrolase [Gammaproteobacteria bacterium]
MNCDVLTLPGLGDSGPRHWQTLWERKHPDWRRVTHRDWVKPEQAEWVAELDAAILLSEGPPLLVAHSLACALVAHWAQSGSTMAVAGAILVAPADPEAPGFPPEASGFAPMPMARLPFPTIVVASSSDPYVTPERAAAFAQAWGSRLIELGDAGHINADSGHGDWPAGERIVLDFCGQLRCPPQV